MSWKKALSLSLAVIFLCAVLAGCGGAKTTTPAEKALRIAIDADPTGLDPRKSSSITDFYVEKQMYEGLTAVNAKGEIVPAVAERWEVSPDGLKYVFHLRADAKWSNGDPVTAQDFEYAWKSALDPKLAVPMANYLYYLKNGEKYYKNQAGADDIGVKAVDDRTLEVTLEQPTAFFLSLMSFATYFPIHKKTAEANPDWTKDPKTMVCNGPFQITEWAHNSKIELVKNDKYWDAGKVKIGKVVFIVCDNAATAVSMFETNQIDISNVPPPSGELERLQKENKAKIFPLIGTYFYIFNTQKAPFDNVKVRKAFQLAIDRSAIVTNITKGGQQPALGFVPLGLSDARPGEDFRKVGGELYKDNDIETARKLLAEAGYPGGKGLPPVALLYNTGDVHKVLAEAIQDMWKKNLGVEVTLTNQEWKVFLQTRKNGDYQVARHNWVGDYLDPMTFIDLWDTSEAKKNSAFYANAEYARLVRLAQTSVDQAARMKAMHEAEKIIIDDAMIMPIYFQSSIVLEKPNVKGVLRDTLSSMYLKEAYWE
ncbi:MAG TPA: peptide ABC transporter substrate-binding protein [Selenomonadales bacterium]|nr:peptide ABC transporter substrate-binding protein [Selenomonadales bacterium]